MGLFGGMKGAVGTPGSGGLLTRFLAGQSGVDASERAALLQKQRSLLGAMPLSNDYAPAPFAAPNGEADPLANVPMATRQQAWLRDLAAAGGDVPLSALMPKPAERQIYNTRRGLVGVGPEMDATPEMIMEIPEDGPAAPTGTMWKDPANPALGVLPLPGYLDAIGGLADTRAAATAKYRRPLAGRGGGGRGGGGPRGPAAPAGNPALAGMEAALRARGLIK